MLTSLKSLYFTGQGCKRTHTLLATTHRNRSEQGLAWEETEKGSVLILSALTVGVKECVYPCVMNTHSARPWWSCWRCAEPGKKGNLDREWVSDFESGHRTHPANHIPRNRQERREGKGWRRGRVREGGGRARVHLSGCVFLCGVSAHKLWGWRADWCIRACVCVRERVYTWAHGIFCQSVPVFWYLINWTTNCSACVPFPSHRSTSLVYVFHWWLSTLSNSFFGGVWRQLPYPLTLNIAIGELQDLLNLAQLLTVRR